MDEEIFAKVMQKISQNSKTHKPDQTKANKLVTNQNRKNVE